MKNRIQRTFRIATLAVALAMFGALPAQAQQDFEEVGGPYEADENTVVLMHFDGNMQNAADTDNGGSTEIAAPDGYGNLEEVTSADFQTLTDMDGRDMGQQIHIDNEANDSTFITIPDTTALDLTGSWTMEAWVFIRGFASSHLTGGRLFFKPGTPPNAAWQSNYFFNIFGGPESFRTGYWENTGDSDHHNIESPAGEVEPNQWKHLTYIRDTTKNVQVQMVHNGVDTGGDPRIDELELTYFASQSFDPIDDAPPVPNESPLFIGNSPQNGGSFEPGDPSTYYGEDNKYLWAYMDELRVSDVVRTFQTPPIVSNVDLPLNADPDGSTPLWQQDYAAEPNESYTVQADITAITGEENFEYARLQYRTGGSGDFQSVPLTEVDDEEDTYEASIPGQSMNTKVEYFLEAKRDDGEEESIQNYTRLPQADSLHYNYAVVPDSSQTLNLTFETGDGENVENAAEAFADDFDIESFGDPEMVDENAPQVGDDDDGSRSVLLDGDGDHLVVRPPGADYMNAQEFALDFWFRADSTMPGLGRWVAKEGLTTSFGNATYRVWSTGDITPAINMGPFAGNNFTGNVTAFDSSATVGKWYNVQLMMEDDTTWAHLIDANGDTLRATGGKVGQNTENSATFLGRGPFRIGAMSNRLDGPGGSQHFAGLIDEVKFYNYVPDEYGGASGTAIDEPGARPAQLTLRPNRPNPFTDETVIEYGLGETGQATLAVYDVLGRKVRTLVDGVVTAGPHEVRFEADGLSSGVYFYRLETENTLKTRKMVVVE